jgi:hypothetical protein
LKRGYSTLSVILNVQGLACDRLSLSVPIKPALGQTGFAAQKTRRRGNEGRLSNALEV